MTTLSKLASSSSILQLLVQILSNRKNISKALGVYILYILIKYKRSVLGVRPRDEIPGPPGYPLIGNALDVIKTPLDKVLQRQVYLHETYGNTYTMSVPFVGRIINVRSPADVEHVLKHNFWAYEKGSRFKTGLMPIVGEGIFSADGQHWKWQRKLASLIFNVRAFRDYTSHVFVSEADLVLSYLGSKADTHEPVDLLSLFYKFTLDSFGHIAYGTSFDCLKNPEVETPFAAAFDRLNHNVSGRFMSPIWQVKDWYTGNDKRVAADSQFLKKFALDLIHTRRTEGWHGKHKDLLQLFMETTTDADEHLTDDMLVDSIMNFVIAGRDTTAQALSWAFYLMHRSKASPEIVENLHSETERVLQGDKPTYESTKQQKYAEACFYEALRLYPSVPKNIKTCVEDNVLPSGTPVYKGEVVGWSSWAMGRDEQIWGPDAKDYNPERWLTGEKPSSAKFVAFHLGPRTCLGQQFATIEAITLMSMMVSSFTFELVDPDTEPEYMASLTLPMAKGLPVYVKRRNTSARAL
ncbi:hypothetical protein BG006_003025 [Podila minutissima]|uniref:Cytochrome P450 n=1 Tax=Podila minutissima TaxID=64525 RepID=A0A9P5VNP5_9FUNG|nr:hypothetical protein BG006_003025 [Podila minutissima]